VVDAMEYSYFSISFIYRLPKSFPHHDTGGGPEGWVHVNTGSPEDDKDCCTACMKAEGVAERILRTLEIEFCHAYSWPDGSCYKYFRISDKDDVTSVKEKIQNLLQQDEEAKSLSMSVEDIHPEDATRVERYNMESVCERSPQDER
jgi:hypothetical protein